MLDHRILTIQRGKPALKRAVFLAIACLVWSDKTAPAAAAPAANALTMAGAGGALSNRSSRREMHRKSSEPAPKKAAPSRKKSSDKGEGLGSKLRARASELAKKLGDSQTAPPATPNTSFKRGVRTPRPGVQPAPPPAKPRKKSYSTKKKTSKAGAKSSSPPAPASEESGASLEEETPPEGPVDPVGNHARLSSDGKLKMAIFGVVPKDAPASGLAIPAESGADAPVSGKPEAENTDVPEATPATSAAQSEPTPEED